MTAISASGALRISALVLYALLFLLSLILVVTSLRANAHLAWSWRSDNLSYTFVPWAVCVGTILCAQAWKPAISWILLAQCVVIGVSLFFAFVNHAFEEKSIPLGSIHLTLAVLFCIWNVYAVVKTLYRSP